MKKLKLILAALLISASVFAQNVGINSDGSSPDASAMLDVSSTTKGFLPPRIALAGTTDVLTISSPATGLLIYNTATVTDVTPGYYYYNGTSWVKIGVSSDATQWTTSVSDIYYNSGKVGIGTSVLGAPLHVGRTATGFPVALFTEDGASEYTILQIQNTNSFASNVVIGTGGGSVSNAAFANKAVFGTTASAPVSLITNDTEKLSITSSGNLGIGNTSPNAKLDIRGEANSSDFRISRDPASATDYYTYITAPGDTPGRSFIGVHDETQGAHVLTMTAEGKLGVNVGNADPVATLQVRDATGSLGTTNDITAEFIRNDGTYNPRLQIRHSTAGTDINHTYSSGTDNLSFSVGDVEAMRIDGDRKVGIGTTTPYSKLEVHDKIIAGDGTSTDGMTILEGRYSQSSGDAVNTLGTMYSSGAWLLGYGMRPKNGSYGHVSSGDNVAWERSGIELSNNFFKLLYAPSQSTTVGSDITGLTTPFYVDLDDGKVGIGTTSPSYALYVNGTSGGTNAWTNDSDERLKKNVIDIENGLEKVMQLRPITFNWKQEEYPDKNFDNRNHIGFIAQEVEEIVPQVVSTADDEMQTKSIAYSDLVPVLTKAIQEQQAQINELKQTVADLHKLLETAQNK